MPVLPLPRLELSRFTGSGKSRAALVVMAVVPALYGGLFLSSNWNPTDHLDRLTAAVVNNDEAVTSDGSTVDAGDTLANNLIDSSTAGFTWKKTTAAAARAGLEDGTFAATAVIPGSFSSDITSVSGDDPEKATVTITTNDATSYILGQVTNSVSTGVEDQVRTATSKQYLDNVYVAFTDLHQELTKAADGATKLADGATTAEAGSGQLVVGLTDLTDGSVTLNTGAQTLASGAKTAATGAATLSSGLNALQQKTRALPSQTRTLNAGAQKARKGSASLARGAKTTASGAASLADGAATLETGAKQVGAATEQVSAGATAIATGTDSTLAGAKTLQSGAASLAGSSPTLAFGAAQVSSGLASLRANYSSLTDAQRQAAIAQLAAAASQVSTGATAVDTGTQQLSTGLNTFVGSAGDGSSLSYLDAQTHVLDSGAQASATGVAKVAAGADKTAAGAAKVATATTQVSAGATSLRSGLKDLAAGTETLANRTPALTAGIKDAADGGSTLSAGNAKLASGAQTLATGASTLSSGATEASAGATSLDSGIRSLEDGSSTLADGLHSGAAAVPSYTASERTSLSNVTSDPVTATRVHTNAVAAYGEGLAPYFMPLALWIGGIVIFLILRPVSARGIASTANGWRVALSGYAAGALFGAIQALVLDAVLVWIVGLDSPYLLAVVLFSVLVALVFTAIHQALVALLAGPGRLIALILLMLQLASAGGTYPVATAPGFFQAISPYLPMTYAVQGFRRLIAGGDVGAVGMDAGALTLFGIGFLLVSVFAVHKNRMWTIERLHPSLAI